MLTSSKNIVVLLSIALAFSSCGQVVSPQQNLDPDLENQVLGTTGEEKTIAPGQVTESGAMLDQEGILNPEIDTVLDQLLPELEQPSHFSY